LHAQFIVAPSRSRAHCHAIKVARSVDCRAVKAALPVSSHPVEVACSVYHRTTVKVARSVDCLVVEATLSVSSHALIFLCIVTRSSSSLRHIAHCCCAVAIFIIAPSR
jgi:hypothetical protein